jgi:hypothetical protein
MRLPFIAACIALPILVLGSLGLGYWMGQHDAKAKYDAGVEALVQMDGVERYHLASQTLAILQAGRYDEAKRVLLTWSRIQVGAIRSCKANPQCQAWSGKHLPSDAEIARLEAAPLPGQDVAANAGSAAAVVAP